MTGNAYILKQRVDSLLSSLTNAEFTDSDKSELSLSLDQLESLNVDREVLKSTKLGASLTKLSKSLQNVYPSSYERVVGIIDKWKNQLRSADSENPAKKQKVESTTDVTDTQSEFSADSGSQSHRGSEPDLFNLGRKVSTGTPDTRRPVQLLTGSDLNSDSLGSGRGLNRNLSQSSLSEGMREDDDLDLPSYSGVMRNDMLRDKALRYLFRSFLIGQDFGPELGMLNELVDEIERKLYEYYVAEKSSQKLYNSQLKSIAFNLKDIKNTLFNYKVYNNIIPVSELVTMTSLQMASDEKKLERNEILEQSLEACQSDWAIKNIYKDSKNAGQFKCGKCHSRQTTYYQLQTRSSDEPMTTFVTCLNCKNRWRF